MLVLIIPAVTSACCLFCLLTFIGLERQDFLAQAPLRKQTAVGLGSSKKRTPREKVNRSTAETPRTGATKELAAQVQKSERRALHEALPGDREGVSHRLFGPHPVWVLHPSNRQQHLLLEA